MTCASRRAVAALAICTVVGCASGDNTRRADDRPLAQRLNSAEDSPASLLPPWWRNAVEASASTVWTLDGNVQDGPDLFVSGSVVSVQGVAGIAEAGDQPNTGGRPAFVEFNSPKAVTDVVAITIKVDEGVAELAGTVPPEVRVVLSMPAPTDLESARRELEQVARLGAIVFKSPYSEPGTPYYDVLDSYFLGPVVEGRVEFGTFGLTSEFFRPESVAIADMIQGAGQIELIFTGELGPQRADT